MLLYKHICFHPSLFLSYDLLFALTLTFAFRPIPVDSVRIAQPTTTTTTNPLFILILSLSQYIPPFFLFPLYFKKTMYIHFLHPSYFDTRYPF